MTTDQGTGPSATPHSIHSFTPGSGGDYVTREEHHEDLVDTKGMLMGVILDMHKTLDWTPRPFGLDGPCSHPRAPSRSGPMTTSRAAQEKPTSPRLPDSDSAEYAIAVMIARSRFGAGVDAGGAHNPRPSEWRMARDIVEMVRREAAAATPSLDCSFGPCEHGSYCERHGHHSVANPFGQPFGHLARLDEGSATPDPEEAG